ncbi:MAG: hypothetical protein ACR2LF_01955 [Jatrophihabitantaceae bacterium]
MPDFESFSRRMLSLKSEPHVTIQRRGAISLNAAALASLGAPASVELLYDRGQAIIGLRPVESRAENAYHVRRASRSPNGPWIISAMAFVKFYDIDTSVTRRCPAVLDGGVLCVNLNNGHTVSKSRPPEAD